MLKQNGTSSSKSSSASGSVKSTTARANTAKSQSASSINSGVSCSVANCTHYCDNGKCKADNIKVTAMSPSYAGTPVSADTKKDTCCGTFRACK